MNIRFTMVVKDKTKDAKIIVNIKSQDLEFIELASKKENRSRNNFVITSAILRANEILSKRSDDGAENNPN
jgi:uncharacterized protein (DUF1778 family)